MQQNKILNVSSNSRPSLLSFHAISGWDEKQSQRWVVASVVMMIYVAQSSNGVCDKHPRSKVVFAAKLFASTCFFFSWVESESVSSSLNRCISAVCFTCCKLNLATYILKQDLNQRIWVNGSLPSWSSVRYNLFHICIDLHVVSRELPTSPSRFIFLFGHCSAPLEQLGGWPLVQGHPSSRRGLSVFLICFANPDLARPHCAAEKAPSSCFLLFEKINLAAYIMFAPSLSGVYMWCSFSCWYLL